MLAQDVNRLLRSNKKLLMLQFFRSFMTLCHFYFHGIMIDFYKANKKIDFSNTIKT